MKGAMVGSATKQPTSIELQASIKRADGSVEELGTVAYWHRNPLKRLAYRLRGGKGKVKRPCG